jgi:hypothetical protein
LALSCGGRRGGCPLRFLKRFLGEGTFLGEPSRLVTEEAFSRNFYMKEPFWEFGNLCRKDLSQGTLEEHSKEHLYVLLQKYSIAILRFKNKL